RGVSAPRPLHRRPGCAAPGSPCRLGPGGGRRDVREAAHRVRGSARWHPTRVHGTAGGSGMNVTRFHHVSVNSNDTPLDEMVEFYRDVLGLGDEPRPEIDGIPGHWHVVGDQQLHLVGAPPSGNVIDTTGHHYCVAVDDLAAAIAELEERGIE